MGDFPSFSNETKRYTFIERIGASYFSRFHSKEEIVEEYRKRGFENISLRHVIDNDGNILAYTFEVFCTHPGEDQGGSGFVRYEEYLDRPGQ